MTTNNVYVVVVEMDNARAFAAYSKGMGELEVIWPQIMEHAQKADDKRRADEKERLEKEKAAIDEWEASKAAHDAWEKASKFSRGPEPKHSHWGRPMSFIHYDPWPMAVDSANSFKRELKRNRDLAGAAISSYRVRERQALDMVAWENGEMMEHVRARFLPRNKP